MPRIQRGAVAMIDALGFRGVWGNDPTRPSLDAFSTLDAVREAVDREVARLREVIKPRRFPPAFQRLVPKLHFESLFLSDTLVVAASVAPRRRPKEILEAAAIKETQLDFPARNEAVDALMRYLVCECVCAAVQAAASAQKPVAYRGVVSIGYFAIEGSFVLGPAVDEAAELMETADGALVWLAPSATKQRHILRLSDGDRWDDMVIDDYVPLKDGRSLRAKLINPFATSKPGQAVGMRRNVLASMKSDRLDVVLKRQNTARFFKALATRAKDAVSAKAREARHQERLARTTESAAAKIG